VGETPPEGWVATGAWGGGAAGGYYQASSGSG